MSNLINQETIFEIKNSNTYQTISPWSYENVNLRLPLIPIISKSELEAIFLKAKNYFETWKHVTNFEVTKKVENFVEELLKDQEIIIKYCHLETGKTLKASKSEFLRTIEFINTSLNVFKNFQDNCFNMDDKLGIFVRQPLGVVLAIGPFNYPINLLVSKIIPALLMKNCLVIKPASSGTITGKLIFNCLIKAGFEDGVVNFVSGKGSEISDLLVTNKNINLINFTGSTFIGKDIAKKAKFSQLIMELGGNDPALVLEDADLLACAKEILAGAFAFNGQRCTAIKRVYVIDKVFEKFKETLLLEFQKSLTFSYLPDVDAVITPLISKSAFENATKILNNSFLQIESKDFEVFSLFLKEAKTFEMVNLRDTLMFKKDQSYQFSLPSKNLILPTLIFIHKANYFSEIEKQEQFAPILPIIKCKSFEEMIFLANNTEYGLQASLFTKNINYINEGFLKINCGTLNINQQTKRSPDIFPFQGIKSSGVSQQGIYQSLINNSTVKGLVIKK